MWKKRRLCYCSLSFLLLCGCAEPKVLEEIGLLTALGYDLAKDGSFNGTLVEMKIDPEVPEDVVVVDTKSYSVRGIRTIANKKTSKRLLGGQLRVVLYGDELLKLGNTRVAKTLTNDPAISDLTYLAMVEGTARDMLHLNVKHIPDIGNHIYKLIDHNTKRHEMPSATLQEVLHTANTIGKDVIMPILKKVENKEIVFSGVAIFKGDKAVGKIDTEQSFYLQLINDKYKAGTIEIIIDSDSSKLKKTNLPHKKNVASIDTVNSKSDIKLVNKKELEFDIYIKVKARMLEINTEVDLGDPKTMELIDKEITKSMENKIKELISYCQSKNSDVFGLGEVYRASVRHSELTNQKWYKMYSNAKVKVKVDLTITRTGLTD